MGPHAAPERGTEAEDALPHPGTEPMRTGRGTHAGAGTHVPTDAPSRAAQISVKAGSGRTRVWSEPPARWDGRRGLTPQPVPAPQHVVTGEKRPRRGQGRGERDPREGHALLAPVRTEPRAGAGPSGRDGSPEGSRGLGRARRAAAPRCSCEREKEKGGDPATSPRQSWLVSSSRGTPCPGRPGGTGTHRQPGRAARAT